MEQPTDDEIDQARSRAARRVAEIDAANEGEPAGVRVIYAGEIDDRVLLHVLDQRSRFRTILAEAIRVGAERERERDQMNALVVDSRVVILGLAKERDRARAEVALLRDLDSDSCREHADACCRDWCYRCQGEDRARAKLEAFDKRAAEPATEPG